jgi:hypothetical protein
MKNCFRKNISLDNRGFVAVLVSLILVMVMISISALSANIIVAQMKKQQSANASLLAHFSAETGAEDALLRVRKGLNFANAYSFTFGSSTVNVSISPPIGGSRTITGQGVNRDAGRKVEVVNSLNGADVRFHFGSQVGTGGVNMSNGSKIIGNVFANNSIIGSGSITGNVIIAGANHKIDGVMVKKDAFGQGGDIQVYTCNNAVIEGTLYYPPGGGPGNCTVNGGSQPLAGPIVEEDLPITQQQIDNWKNEAEAGGIFSGNYTLGNNENRTIGPLKIQGNLVFSNSNTLTLTGTIWVSGNVIMGNSTIIQMDNASYGANSGVLITDGTVGLGNNVVIRGTGQAGSYMMLLTTSPANPAITVSNNSDSGIFYASNGFITLANNCSVKEITAYGLTMTNNVTVTYEIGLQNLFFTSGPGAGWSIESWKTIE